MTVVPRTKASVRRGTGCGLLAASLCLLVAGCTVGPNYKRPDAPVPPAYKENNGTQATVPPPNPPGGTWKPAQAPPTPYSVASGGSSMRDPQLNSLEDKVAVSNQDAQGCGRAVPRRSRSGEGDPRRLLPDSFRRPNGLTRA